MQVIQEIQKKGKLLTVLLLLFVLVFFTKNVAAAPKFQLVYVVEEGDTLIEIARKFGLTVKELRIANKLDEDSFIRAGDRLFIPIEQKEDRPLKLDISLQVVEPLPDPEFRLEDSVMPVVIKKSLPHVHIPEDKLILYHIKTGDTLYELAKKFNTTVTVLKALNQLESGVIRIGQKLLLPINNLTPREVILKTVTNREIELLARAIHGEARGESFIGQVAVGAVIINRIIDPRFPDTFEGVIFQKGQFTCVADGQINLKPDRTAYRAARTALRGTDPTLGALYYYNPRTARNRWWFRNRRITVTIGNHVFTK